ncbi:MAG: RluA family pseudouridine synthase [Treponema sp.]|nr:RluA family pseudouridine synthase [Treponema sp.]
MWNPARMRITVLFEDTELLALDKPSGLAVQGGAGVGTSLDALLAEAWSPAPRLLHRLDRETSGIVLAAKTPQAAAKYARFFREGRIKKKYLGICAGGAAGREGRVTGDLAVRGKPKAAETGYTFLAGGSVPAGAGTVACSLVELEPASGRTHQIRRHLAGLGLPLLGDDKYGDFALNRALKKAIGLKRFFLHAAVLDLPGGRIIVSPLPPRFAAFLETAGIAAPR